jgi:hypothetical protein
MSNQIGAGHLTKESTLENAEDLIGYLIKYYGDLISAPNAYLENGKYEELMSFEDILNHIEFLRMQPGLDEYSENLIKTYPAGTIIEGEVVNRQKYGVFVEFGLNANGFIHISEISKLGKDPFQDIELGDLISAEIVEFTRDHNRFKLKLVNKGLSA